MLAQVDEMIENEEKDRIRYAINKELSSIDDDIRYYLFGRNQGWMFSTCVGTVFQLLLMVQF